MSVTVLFVLSFIILVGAAYLHFSKENMYEKKMSDAYEGIRKSNETLDKKISDMSKTLDLYGERFLVLERELKVAREKADTADFIAHSAKMDYAKGVKPQSVKVEFSPIKMYHVTARKRVRVTPIEKKPVDKVQDAVINDIKKKMVELNQ